MNIVHQVFLFSHFVSAANETLHLKLIQRESQLGLLFTIHLFKHHIVEACWEVGVKLHEFLTATQDMFSVLFHTLVTSQLKDDPSESTEQQADIGKAFP